MLLPGCVTEDGFCSGFRALFPSGSQKYPGAGQGEKALDGDLRPPWSGVGKGRRAAAQGR